MTGVWVLAAAVVLFDLLVARQIVVEYRRYRYRRIMQKAVADLNAFVAAIGEALLPAMRSVTAAFGEFAKVFGELYEESDL